jgi:hypothetical protein
LEFVDPGDVRGPLVEARASGVVIDYVIVACDEDPGDGEILRRVVLFTKPGTANTARAPGSSSRPTTS